MQGGAASSGGGSVGRLVSWEPADPPVRCANFPPCVGGRFEGEPLRRGCSRAEPLRRGRLGGVKVANGLVGDFGGLPIWSGWLGVVGFWKPLEGFVGGGRLGVGVGRRRSAYLFSCEDRVAGVANGGGPHLSLRDISPRSSWFPLRETPPTQGGCPLPADWGVGRLSTHETLARPPAARSGAPLRTDLCKSRRPPAASLPSFLRRQESRRSRGCELSSALRRPPQAAFKGR